MELEVSAWYLGLDRNSQNLVAVHIELLAYTAIVCVCRTVGHSEADYSKLRFDMTRCAWRITSWYRPDGVIVLLTVFRKQRNNETTEIRRARRALDRCREIHNPN